MTSPREPDPAPHSALDLAAQLQQLRGQVAALTTRLDNDIIGKQLAALAGIKQLRATTGELSAKIAELSRAVGQAPSEAPGGPAAPYWIGLDPQDHADQLTELREWAGTILRAQYGGYTLPPCWANHPHAIWELSTLAAEWHRTYHQPRPDLDRALEFYDRWLPGTMRRITDITQRCNPQCVTTQPRRSA